MAMVKKSISLTEQQDRWIKTQIATGRYGNESEIFRELIRERQAREQESPEEIEAINRALMAAEEGIRKSGHSEKSVDQIWKEARASFKAKHG